ncbi:hypothetical protein PVL29_006367 [Vitis rotundifolia]|uniref:Uncharacterized protein n=1 Tax=Vitis rotundifolia TaxID=103349 RepID=A0AA39A506_VITRO|nr:hypothetical protein PVL29_006367 [Vitis rotundifolia]
MDVELAVAMWHVKMIYDWTPTVMWILDAPTPTALWLEKMTDDSSLIGMEMLDFLMEVATSKTLEMMDVELAAAMWLAEMIYN